MNCQFCGANNAENSKFCMKCGRQIEVPMVEKVAFRQAEQPPVKKTKKKKGKKGKIIFFSILAAVLALIITFTALFFTSDAYGVSKAFNEGDIEKALKNYRNDVKDDFVQKTILNMLINNGVNEISEEYLNKQYDYKTAVAKLDALNEMGASGAWAKRTEILDKYTQDIISKYENGEIKYSFTMSELNAIISMNCDSARFEREKLMAQYAEETFEGYEKGEIKYDEAIAILQTIKNDGYEEVDKLIKEINSNNQEVVSIEKADDHRQNGEFEEAINELSQIPENSENYETAQEILKKVYVEYAEAVLTTAKNYNDKGEYKQAIQLVSNAYNILPKDMDKAELDAVVAESLASYQATIASDIDALVADNNWTEAFKLIDDAIAFDNSEYFLNLKTVTENRYAQSITATVQGYLTNEDYITAKRVVENALTVLPDNGALKDLKKDVEKKTPTYLLDVCEPYSKNGYKEYSNGETFKSAEKSYTNGFRLDYCGSAIFNVDSLYTNLSFTVGHVDNSAKMPTTVKIYCDEILKTELYMMPDDLPQKVSVDITGVKQLKISVTQDKKGSVWISDSYYAFGNVIVK